MRLRSITVRDVRNIESAQLEPEPELTVLCGENGQGKTNMLEAVWLLTGSKSFRGSRDDELVREGQPNAGVEGEIETSDRTTAVRVFIGGRRDEHAGRSAFVNGVDYGRASNIAGFFTAVQFQPDHLALVKGAGETRRRFIDAALCQLYPSYVETLRRYSRYLVQRNALLKNIHGGRGDESLLDVFDVNLARTGGVIMERRAKYLALIAPEAENTYRDITSGRETLTVRYRPCADGPEALLALLAENRQENIALGYTTAGPHREDLSIRVNGKDAKKFASQGQQRSAVLSLKLAEAFGAHKITGEHPVMLLDDVLSELDGTRQSYLLSRTKHRQTIVTACDESLFSHTGGRVYRVSGGRFEDS